MAKGTVDFFNPSGGYGFIRSDGAEDDVFFHLDDERMDEVVEGQSVRFDIVMADKGPRATNMAPAQYKCDECGEDNVHFEEYVEHLDEEHPEKSPR